MFCKECGEKITLDAVYCKGCGREIDDNDRLALAVVDFQDGNKDAFNNIYELSNKYIFFTIRKSVNDDAVIQDVFQDTYLEIYKNLTSLKNVVAFKSWAATIAQHKITHYYMKNPNNTVDEEEIGDTIVEEDNDFLPEDALENKETQRLIKEIMDELPVKHKEVIISFYYNQMSIAEIAEAMEIPQNTVKTYLSRGKAKIKEGVIQLEKTQGTKLYSISLAPFLFMLFGEEAAESTVVIDGLAKVTEYSRKLGAVSTGISTITKFLATLKGKIIAITAATATVAVCGVGYVSFERLNVELSYPDFYEIIRECEDGGSYNFVSEDRKSILKITARPKNKEINCLLDVSDIDEDYRETCTEYVNENNYEYVKYVWEEETTYLMLFLGENYYIEIYIVYPNVAETKYQEIVAKMIEEYGSLDDVVIDTSIKIDYEMEYYNIIGMDLPYPKNYGLLRDDEASGYKEFVIGDGISRLIVEAYYGEKKKDAENHQLRLYQKGYMETEHIKDDSREIIKYINDDLDSEAYFEKRVINGYVISFELTYRIDNMEESQEIINYMSNYISNVKIEHNENLKDYVGDWVKKQDYSDYDNPGFYGRLRVANDGTVTLFGNDDKDDKYVGKVINIKEGKDCLITFSESYQYYKDINSWVLNEGEELSLIMRFEGERCSIEVISPNYKKYIEGDYIKSIEREENRHVL